MLIPPFCDTRILLLLFTARRRSVYTIKHVRGTRRRTLGSVWWRRSGFYVLCQTKSVHYTLGSIYHACNNIYYYNTVDAVYRQFLLRPRYLSNRTR